MKRFIEGENQFQSTYSQNKLDNYISEDNPVSVIDVFINTLDLKSLSFKNVDPSITDRPGYHPATMLKLYIYGYLNRIQSSRRLERETQCNIEMVWLTQRLLHISGDVITTTPSCCNRQCFLCEHLVLLTS